MKADKVLRGKVFTANRQAPYAEAVAIKGDRFVYVGDAQGVQDYVGPDTEVIEGGDGIFLPGMCDSHMHFSSGAVEHNYMAPVYNGEKVADYQQILADFVKEHPGRDFYMGSGWDNAAFENEGIEPTKALWDEVCPDVPVLVQSYDGHSWLVNSACLKNAGIGKGYVTKEKGKIVLDPKTQEPTGLVREWAMNDVLKSVRTFTVEEIKEVVLKLQDQLISLGLTSLYEPILRFEENAQQALQELDIEGRLKLKVVSGFYCKPEKEGLDKIDRCAEIRDSYHGRHYRDNNIKFVLDGVVESGTCYLFDEFANNPGFHGNFNCTQDQFNAMVARAKEDGFQVHVHAIGDAAVDAALTGFEYALAHTPASDWRPTITHLQVMRDSDIDRMAKIHAIASTDPAWHYKDPECYESLEVAALGKERASREYPLERLWKKGIVVSTATDFPVTNPDPMESIEVGATRCEPGDHSEKTMLDAAERVPVEDMLYASTINGAYQNCWEHEIGSIEIGKCADVALMDKDITKIDPHDIHKATCKLTMIDGQVAYRKEGE